MVTCAPKVVPSDMDGTLLITTQSDQSWQQVCDQFAPHLGLPQKSFFTPCARASLLLMEGSESIS
jgi:UDP:flavonoid glycosyltransferase YjiC (YdhE family)